MIHFSITSAMLCMNFHKFSTSILARNLVHVLKAVAILTGGYWNFYAPEAINITNLVYWSGVLDMLISHHQSKYFFQIFWFQICYFDWLFARSGDLWMSKFYFIYLMFFLWFFLLLFIISFFFYSFIFGTDEVIPSSAHCPHYRGLTAHRAKESWNYFESLNKNS